MTRSADSVASQAGVLPAPAKPPARLAPKRSLPAYRFVPGVLPHPFRDPDGHDHLAKISLPEPAWEPGSSWTENVHHRYAIDLFQHRFYWESHEVWEAVWLLLPQGAPERELIQALIQVAASTLKRHMAHPRAAGTLIERAVTRLNQARQAGPVVCGVDIDALMERIEREETWPTLTLVGFTPEA